METDIRCSEPSSRAFEREMATSAEQWSNWITNQICSAIENERERTFELLTELVVGIKKDVIPEVVATLPALRGPAGPVGPTGKLPIAKEWTRETVFYEGYVVAGHSRKTRNTRLLTWLRSILDRFSHCMTSPARVLDRGGNCSLRRASAASLAKEGRRAIAVPPGRRVRTPPRWWAGISTARASP